MVSLYVLRKGKKNIFGLALLTAEADAVPDIVLDHNESERFECRFSTVRIEKSKAMMLQGMSDSVLGVWVAHGEGTYSIDLK